MNTVLTEIVNARWLHVSEGTGVCPAAPSLRSSVQVYGLAATLALNYKPSASGFPQQQRSFEAISSWWESPSVRSLLDQQTPAAPLLLSEVQEVGLMSHCIERLGNLWSLGRYYLYL